MPVFWSTASKNCPITSGTDWIRFTSSCAWRYSFFRFLCSSLMYSSCTSKNSNVFWSFYSKPKWNVFSFCCYDDIDKFEEVWGYVYKLIRLCLCDGKWICFLLRTFNLTYKSSVSKSSRVLWDTSFDDLRSATSSWNQTIWIHQYHFTHNAIESHIELYILFHFKFGWRNKKSFQIKRSELIFNKIVKSNNFWEFYSLFLE